jgi:cell division septum initiation protein DivIVA
MQEHHSNGSTPAAAAGTLQQRADACAERMRAAAKAHALSQRRVDDTRAELRSAEAAADALRQEAERSTTAMRAYVRAVLRDAKPTPPSKRGA